MPDPAEVYTLNDDCATGQCSVEGVIVAQKLNDFELDQAFAGSAVDSQLELDLASIEEVFSSDDLFPPIMDSAPLTLPGLMDAFARKYPERAMLLDMLINGEGYDVEFVETPTEREQELEEYIGNVGSYLRDLRRRAVTNDQYRTIRSFEQVQAETRRELNAMRHWHIEPGKIFLSTRINRNIDKFNWFGIQDEDLINPDVTNGEGADWLNAVMGDWMVRSGIPGADRDEEFSDSFSRRVTWGTLNVIVGFVEIIGGVGIMLAGTASGIGLAAGIAAGAAMTVAGFEAITQGVDMMRTPNEASHQTGWLGDAAFAMATRYGVLDTNDQASFNKYWSFTMLGLSLGGTGVAAYLARSGTAFRTALNAQRMSFYRQAERAIDQVRLGIIGVKDATFGRLVARYAALPSGRIAFNIRRVGRMVVNTWESLPRLRLRMTTAKLDDVLERARTLRAGEAGLVSMRGGVQNVGQARKLVYEVGSMMGLSGPDVDRIVGTITLGTPGEVSAFRLSDRRLRIAYDIGNPRNLRYSSNYNELVAINEVAHELHHALRLDRWLKRGRSVEDYLRKYGRQVQNGRRYWVEEIQVETAASEALQNYVRPRIELARLKGATDEVDRLTGLLDEALEDTEAYLRYSRGRAGQ